MKRIFAILLVSVLIFGICGCAKSNNTCCCAESDKEEAAANDLFTDEFFSDVVRIRSDAGVAGGCEHMKPVIRYLKSLKLKETDEDLRTTNEKGELLYGMGFITFDKDDGTEVSFLHSHGMLTLPGDTPKSYVLDRAETDSDINLNIGLKDAFDEGNGIDTAEK